VRIVLVNDEPWFVAADVCAVLDLKNVAMAVRHLDDDEKGISNVDTLGGNQLLTIISESGFYILVLRSRKPEAKPFRRWVTGEVLPTIRKTGRYSNRPETPEETQRRQTALDFAFEASKVAARTVADAFLSGEGLSSSDRYLLTMNWNSGTRRFEDANVQAIDHDDFIMSWDDLTRAIGEPDYLVESEKLTKLASACCQRLVKRLPLPKKAA
jgi:prophage antirepressor-like protein